MRALHLPVSPDSVRDSCPLSDIIALTHDRDILSRIPFAFPLQIGIRDMYCESNGSAPGPVLDILQSAGFSLILTLPPGLLRMIPSSLPSIL